MLTKATLLGALANMRTQLPCVAVTITIRGVQVQAIERQGVTDQEASGMGNFPGEKGHFILTGAEPDGMADGDLITITRGGNPQTLRIVGIGRPAAGIVRVYYGDHYGRGRVG